MTPEEEREWLWELERGGVRPETWELIAGIVAQRDAERERNAKLERVAEASRLSPRNALRFGHTHHGGVAGFCDLCAALAALEVSDE